MIGGGRTDDDERAFARAQHRMEFAGAGHQAHQVDFKHFAKSGHFEFAAPVDHRALRQHQGVEPVECRFEILDRAGIADVELGVIQALKMRSLAWQIIGGGSAGTADLHACALGPERLCDAVADAAGAADHQNLLAAEIHLVHRAPLDVLSLRLTSLGFSASLVNPTAHDVSFSEHSMSDFKQLSRSVAGLTVLVTGAASGMGRATARVFAAEGAKVAVTDFTAEGAQAVVKEIAETGGTAKAWTLDVANRDDIDAVVNNIAAHFGGLGIVINNAGISVRVAIDDDTYDEAWTKGLAVLLTAHQRVIRAALPYLRKSRCPRIVNIASTEALGATALHSPYSAAKAGVVGLTRSLAVELGRDGITVNCICPGPITTAMTARISDEHKAVYARRRTALGRYGDPEEVAHMTLSLCLPAASFLTGAIIPVDGGLVARNA